MKHDSGLSALVLGLLGIYIDPIPYTEYTLAYLLYTELYTTLYVNPRLPNLNSKARPRPPSPPAKVQSRVYPAEQCMILHVCIRLLGGPTLPKNHGSGVEESYWVGKVTRGQRMRHTYIHMYIHDSFADYWDSR